jgi:c-di-GMP-related signal transduction protein
VPEPVTFFATGFRAGASPPIGVIAVTLRSSQSSIGGGRIFGYGALCRTARTDRFTGDSRYATHSIIRDWLLDGLNKFTGTRTVFLNCTCQDLSDEFQALLPVPVVLEVLETVQADEWVIETCRRIKAFGHHIALDHFELDGSHGNLLDLADYIKVDFPLWDREQRRGLLRSLKGRPVQSIAQNIETFKDFEAALDEGFDLLQGFYLARPVLLSKARSYASLFNHLRLRWLSRKRRRWSSPARYRKSP